MSTKIENLFPQEIQRAIVCLSDDNRQKIISKLMETTEIAYTTLKDSVMLTKGNLNHHLSELIKAGIITKFLRNTAGDPYESFYKISEFGRDFINGVFESLKPTESRVLTRADVSSISQPTRRVFITSDFEKSIEVNLMKEYVESRRQMIDTPIQGFDFVVSQRTGSWAMEAKMGTKFKTPTLAVNTTSQTDSVTHNAVRIFTTYVGERNTMATTKRRELGSR